MASITGGVPFIGFVSPTDEGDLYPVTNPKYGLGGLRTIGLSAGLTSISTQRREEGMIVYAIDERKYYHLFDGTGDEHWKELTLGGGEGVTGNQGFQGVQGFTGPTGVQGFQGNQGDTGPQGFQGNQGDTGPQGFQGNQGDTGPQGFQGNQGDTGPQGFQGNQGDTGSQGFQGNQGDTGSQGYQGGTGPQGHQGPTGIIGRISDGTNSITGTDVLLFLGGTGIVTTANIDTVSKNSAITISEIGWQRGGETFPQTVGGVAAGTSFGQGTSINTILETLLFPYQPVSLSNFNIGFPKEVYEVGETAGNDSYVATWSFSGPTSNWIENSMYISASDGIGVISSGFNYDDTSITVSHSAYKYNAEKTLTFTITGDQEEGSNPSSSDPIYWRYKYFHGKTGDGFDGTNLLNQGFTETLDKNRTSPIGWNITFDPGENYLYVIFPSSEYTGSIRFRDNNSGFVWPFGLTPDTFTHINEHGISIDYKIYQSSTETSAALNLTIEVND